MHIITRKRLNEFADLHPTSRSALSHWFQIVKKNNFNSFMDLRKSFASADQVGGLTVFNIGGNKARFVAAIHYNRTENLCPCYLDPRTIQHRKVEGVIYVQYTNT